MNILTAAEIQDMIQDLGMVNTWLRDLDRMGISNYLITDPARVKVMGIMGKLLAASLADVRVKQD